MSAIAIYMEGGGRGEDARDILRRGMDGFLGQLKNMARARSWRWKLVCCGGRGDAFNAFTAARKGGGATHILLLVDSEAPVAAGPRAHLAVQDGWHLDDVDDDRVHLMVQTMETWIVADPKALADYYGQGFQASVLPEDKEDLETVAKNTLVAALKQATRCTRKGNYYRHKIHHAADLLKSIDPDKVQLRCPHAARLFTTLAAALP